MQGGETAMQTDEQLTNLSLDDEGRYPAAICPADSYV